MRSKKDIDYVYKQNLEESIIEYLSKEKKLELRQAMDIYYQSRDRQWIFIIRADWQNRLNRELMG